MQVVMMTGGKEKPLWLKIKTKIQVFSFWPDSSFPNFIPVFFLPFSSSVSILLFTVFTPKWFDNDMLMFFNIKTKYKLA